MTNIPCSIVLDLLPSYVDGLCSEETAALVKAHLSECESCREAYEALKAPMEMVSQTKTISIPNPFSKIRKKHLRNLVLAIACTAALVLLALAPFLADQIPFVHDFFQPTQIVGIRIEEENSGWHPLTFEDGYLVYDSPFYDCEIINYATNETPAQVRVRDEQGNMVVEPFDLEPGIRYRPPKLERNTKYQVEVNVARAGTFFFTFA